MFAPAQLFRNWREQRPSNQVILTRVWWKRYGKSIRR
jgi:hypothetical protein